MLALDVDDACLHWIRFFWQINAIDLFVIQFLYLHISLIYAICNSLVAPLILKYYNIMRNDDENDDIPRGISTSFMSRTENRQNNNQID